MTSALSNPEARELVRTAVLSGEDEVSDELRDQVVALGEAAIPALVEVVEDDSFGVEDGPGEGYAQIHAADLLGAIGSPLGAQALLEALPRWNDEDASDMAYDSALQALSKLASAEQLLALHDATDDRAIRDSCLSILSEIGTQHERIYELLLARLEGWPEFIAGCLASYGDPRAIEPLGRLLEQVPISDDWEAHRHGIEFRGAILTLGGALTPAQEERWEAIHAAWEERVAGRRLDWDWTESLVDEEGDYDPEAFSAFRRELLFRFCKSKPAQTLDEGSEPGYWVTLVLTFCLDECRLDPSEMDHVELDHILFYCIPKNVPCGPEVSLELIAELEAFYAFARSEGMIGDPNPFLRVLTKARRVLPGSLADTNLWSRGKTRYLMGQKAGFDMSTDEGTKAFEAYEAEALAAKRSAREAQAAKAQKRAAKAKKDKRKKNKRKRR